MRTFFPTHLLVLAVISAGLSACGGGGGDSGGSSSVPVGASISFPLQAGYKARISAGATDNFNVTGTCTGTATFTSGATSPATFEGVAGLSSADTETISLNGCSPATISVTQTSYYDANYNPIGNTIVGQQYGTYQNTVQLPATVKVGDTAVVGTLTTYSDSTKTTQTGHNELSYSVGSDTSTSATLTLISKAYDISNQLQTTELDKYRIALDGTLTILSIDVQFSGTSTTHLVLTKS